MKTRFLALAALVLGLASCQNNFDEVRPSVADEVDFQLSVDASELATRAGLDGADDGIAALESAYGAIDYLQAGQDGDQYRVDWTDVDLRYSLEVYDQTDDYSNAVPVKNRMVQIVDEYQPVKFDLRLVPGRNYRFVVFADFVAQDATDNSAVAAQAELGLHHNIGETLREITVKEDGLNDECTDAYFAIKDVLVKDSRLETVVLKRPYAKLRVIATDLAELNLNVDPAKVEVIYEEAHMSLFNAVTGKISTAYTTKSYTTVFNEGVGKKSLANHFYTADYDALTEVDPNGNPRHTHITLFTDYILATDEQSPVHFKMNVYEKNGDLIKTTEFDTEIPVQRNYLTTIVGNVMTTASHIDVSINDNFAGKHNVAVWDGVSVVEPQKDAEGNYVIAEASELAWLAAAVNGTISRASEPQTFLGETFKLTKDIDLNGELWTPIGGSTKHNATFRGSFDGQGHTVTGLYVVEAEGAGLFGKVSPKAIENLTITDATIVGNHYAGALAAWVQSVDSQAHNRGVIKNCHVKNSTVTLSVADEDNGDKAGALLGYTVRLDVEECSAENVEVSAYRDVAGLVGCANDGSVVRGNSVKNAVITADQTVKYGEVAAVNAGKVAGRISKNATVENNTVENVEVIVKVDNAEELAYAVATAESGDSIYVANCEAQLPHFENKALTFVGIDANATIVEPVSSHQDAFWKGAELNFVDLKIVGTKYSGSANGYVQAVKETYTNCKFENYYMFAGDETIVAQSTFTNEGQYFWTGAANVITFNECTFNAQECAVKVCTVGNKIDAARVANFNDCTFKAAEGKKAALEVDGSKGSSYVVNINRCTVEGFAAGEFTGEPMFNIEGGENVELYMDGFKWDGYGFVDENGYTLVKSAEQLAALVNEAKAEVKAAFAADLKGDIELLQQENVNVVIDGRGRKYEGTITVNGNARFEGAETLLLTAINFESSVKRDFILSPSLINNVYSYPHNLTLKECKFVGNPEVDVVAVRLNQGKNIAIENCVGEGLHSLVQSTGCTGFAVRDTELKNCARGASFGTLKDLTLEGVNFPGLSKYGIRVDGTKEYTVDVNIKNSNIEAYIPVCVRKLNEDAVVFNLVLEGENTLKRGGAYDIAMAANEYEEGVEAVAPMGELSIVGADNFVVFPASFPNKPCAWSVVGSFTANQWNDDVAMVTTLAKNLFVAKNVALKAGDAFKVRKDKTWTVNYGGGDINTLDSNIWVKTYKDGADLVVVNEGSYDIYFEYAEGKEYSKVYLVEAGGDYTVAEEQTKNGQIVSGGETPDQPSTWALAGDFNSWGDLAMVTTTVSEVFVAKGVKFAAYKEFKVKTKGSWNTSYGGGITYLNSNIWTKVYSAGSNLSVINAGTYDIYFDNVNKRIYVMNEGVDFASAVEQSKNGAAPDLSGASWGLCGAHNGWNSPDTKLEWDGTIGLYVAKSAKLTGEFKVRANNSWGEDYGCGGTITVNASAGKAMSRGGGNCRVASGTYDVYFDLATKKIWVKTPGSAAPTK